MNYGDYSSKTDKWLSNRQQKIWNELDPLIRGTGASSLIEELCEVERELTLREESPY